MFYFLTIIHYAAFAGVDIMDKFILSKRKVIPFAYLFFTVVTGLVLLLAWPFVYVKISGLAIVLDLLSGVSFSLAMYAFFKALSEGEVSRVVPFIFGIMPLFDVLLSALTGTNILTLREYSALMLLIPGALLMGYKKPFVGRHVSWKVLAAFLLSVNALVWQLAARGEGTILNHLMWNRIGAAGAIILCLVLPQARVAVKAALKAPKRGHTSGLFVFKQLLGGSAFLLASYLVAVGKISVFSSLQGVRYLVIFLVALFLSKKFRHILDEDITSHVWKQKLAGLILIVGGTLMLFLL